MSTKIAERHPALQKLMGKEEETKALMERVFRDCKPTKRSLAEIRREFSKGLKENELSRLVIEERA